MKELEELQKKAEVLAAGLEQVNKQIEELKNPPTEFDKLPSLTLCLVGTLGSSGTNNRLAFKVSDKMSYVKSGPLL